MITQNTNIVEGVYFFKGGKMTKEIMNGKYSIAINVDKERREDLIAKAYDWCTRLRKKDGTKPEYAAGSSKDLRKYVTKKIDKCLRGWTNPPKSLEARIEMLLGFRENEPNKVFGSLKGTYEVLESERLDDIYYSLDKSSIAYEIINMKGVNWTKAEINLIIKKDVQYQNFYTFNDANDRTNLMALIIEEMRLRKLQTHSLQQKSPEREVNQTIKDTLKNIKDLQDSLGITAKQRIENEKGGGLTLEHISDRYFELIEAPEDMLAYRIEEMIVIARKILSKEWDKLAFKIFFGITFEEGIRLIARHANIFDEELNMTLNVEQFVKVISLKVEDFERPSLKDDFDFHCELEDLISYGKDE